MNYRKYMEFLPIRRKGGASDVAARRGGSGAALGRVGEEREEVSGRSLGRTRGEVRGKSAPRPDLQQAGGAHEGFVAGRSLTKVREGVRGDGRAGVVRKGGGGGKMAMEGMVWNRATGKRRSQPAMRKISVDPLVNKRYAGEIRSSSDDSLARGGWEGEDENYSGAQNLRDGDSLAGEGEMMMNFSILDDFAEEEEVVAQEDGRIEYGEEDGADFMPGGEKEVGLKEATMRQKEQARRDFMAEPESFSLVRTQIEIREQRVMPLAPPEPGISMKEKLAREAEEEAERQRQELLAIAERQKRAMQETPEARLARRQRETMLREQREAKRLEEELARQKERLAKLREKPHFINTAVEKRPLSDGRERRTGVGEDGSAMRGARMEGMVGRVGGAKMGGEMTEMARSTTARASRATGGTTTQSAPIKAVSRRVVPEDAFSNRSPRFIAPRPEPVPPMKQRERDFGQSSRVGGAVIVPNLSRRTVNLPAVVAATVLAGAVVGVIAYFVFLAK